MLSSRIPDELKLVAHPVGSCPDLVHRARLLSSLFGKVEKSKQTVCPKNGQEGLNFRINTQLSR